MIKKLFLILIIILSIIMGILIFVNYRNKDEANIIIEQNLASSESITEQNDEISYELEPKKLEIDSSKIAELIESDAFQNKINNESDTILKSTEDIQLKDADGNGKNYLFTYNDERYTAIYTKDNWKIVNSYKITNENDMAIICQALIDVHPIHGKDMTSYRTVDDLVYEWKQHNTAYKILPDDNPWKSNAKDVDLNPEDQGRTLEEMYEARTGKKLFDN